MDETQARTFNEARSGYITRLSRMTRIGLAAELGAEMAERGQTLLYGGPTSKDELMSALVGIRYPLARLNESIHVLYHAGGVVNEICAWCNPNPCPACGALEACDYDPAHGPVVNGRHINV